MIIKEIRIKNFRSYYGDNNRFEFSDGLTVIIGDNGDGKTTFFEAIQWLLNTMIENSNIEQVSEMRKSKMETGDIDEVSVSMRFEHNGEKYVEKSFSFEKLENGNLRLGKIVYHGYETKGAERESVNGKTLIERCYEAFIQRFSMFKGEAELNIFDNAALLKDLVDKFSDIRKFDELVDVTQKFEEKANSAYVKEMRSDKKVAEKARILDTAITRLSSEIATTKKDIRDKKTSIETFVRQLTQLEENYEVSERYHDITQRLKTQEDKRNKLLAMINNVVFNHNLLDEMWILAPYPPILKEYQKKVSDLSKAKRKMDREFERTKSIEIGKLEAYKELQGALANGATELPWYLPDQQTMEDMIHDQICKVCGRPAPIGTEAYEFMVKKLEEYKRHAEAKLKRDAQKDKIDDREMFPLDHIGTLHNMSVSLSGTREAEIVALAQEIQENQEYVAQRKEDVQKISQKIQDLVDEKTTLLIQSGNISGTALDKEFNDVKGMFDQRERATNRLAELENELKHQEEDMANLKKELEELDPESSQVKELREVHTALVEIANAFAIAQKSNLKNFLMELEEKANEYMARLSAADFHGEIRLIQTANDSTEIRLYSSNDTEIKKPSGSQKTVMYISVLFAISDFTEEKRDEDYPLIFDAATSSFGDSKEEDFYNVIDKIKKQCIIVTKDFIEKGKLNEPAIDRLTCSVYRIKKAPNFDPLNMATIRTLIEKIR